jgi:uncharacterized protein (DUF305 family)
MASPATTSSSGRRVVWVVVAAVLAACLVSAALLVGARLGDEASAHAATPDDASVDAGFARDMQRHHAQAVEMSLLVLNGSGDPEIRTLASDILLTQQQQVGQMYAWLDTWGLSQTTSADPMQWMAEHADHSGGTDHPMPASEMPGMASDRQLEALAAARPGEVDRRFLQLMIPHHAGALDMAQYAADHAATAHVRHLAEAIVAAQTNELTVLRDLLAERRT